MSCLRWVEEPHPGRQDLTHSVQSPDPLPFAPGAGRADPQMGVVVPPAAKAGPPHLRGPGVSGQGDCQAEGARQRLLALVAHGGASADQRVGLPPGAALVSDVHHTLKLVWLILEVCSELVFLLMFLGFNVMLVLVQFCLDWFLFALISLYVNIEFLF